MPGRRMMNRALIIGGLALLSPNVAIAATATSTTSTPSAVAVTLGGSVSDSATVTGDPLVGVPTGTVSFSVCGPAASASGCSAGGTPVGLAVALTPGAIDTATATSDAFTPTAVGAWCFRADYSGDANYAGSSDGSVTECFTVTAASSSTSSSPGSGSIVLGGSNGDMATVTGNAAGGSPTGTVSFFACGPQTSAAGCASGGQAVGAPVSLVAGSADTSTAGSPSFTPTATGTWCFRADYSGDANYAGSSDGSVTECFTVTAASSSTSSTPASGSIVLGGSDSDTATVTGNAAGGSPTGTVSFFACGPLTSASGCPSGDGQAVGAPVSLVAGSGDTSTAGSPSFTPTAAGTWCFRAEYSGDANYAGSSDGSMTECFTVPAVSSSTSSTPASGSIVLGGSNRDTATVTGNSVGGSPAGTVSFFVCGPLTSASGCPSGGVAVGPAVALSGGGDTASATSAGFTPSSAGTWCFGAVYSGGGNYASSSDTSSHECFTVTTSASSTSSAPVSGSIVFGGSDADSATVTGNATGGSPTGTVSFFVCGPLTSAAGCPTGGQAVGAPISLVAASPDTSTASSPSFAPTAAGTWCFRAEYSGDSNYAGSSDAGGAECFTAGKAAASVSSTPSSVATTLAGSETDSATVTGNGVGQSPGGTVSFYICGPLTSPQGCASGGQAVGGGVGLTPASATTATGTSPSFTPTASGVWCFRADYSGDGNYSPASDVASGNCFTVPQPGAPTATITSPVTGSVYGIGHPVAAAYSCAEAPGGPGLASCAGGTANGAPVDTSARGQHSLDVTAVSRDGLKTTVASGYTVAGPPAVTVSSPADGAAYARGMSVPVSFTCSEDDFGPGLVSCSAPPSISTWQTGAFVLTATATSADGLQSTQTVHYSVVLPSNRFAVSRVRSLRGSRVTFTIVVPVQGHLVISETVPRRLMKPAAVGRAVLDRLNLFVTRGGTLNLVLLPTKHWRTALAQRRPPMKAQLTIIFTPTNGVTGRKELNVRLLPRPG